MWSDFLNYDDIKYVHNNPYMNLSWPNVKNHLSLHDDIYTIITRLSMSVDYAIGGFSSATFHLINVIIHLFNMVLVYQLILKLNFNRNIALITAMLSGIHPLHVESVAWVSQRKDVLYTFFFLCSLLAYIAYVKRGSLFFYVTAFLLFGLSLMSKGMAIALPPTLIAVDFALKRKGFIVPGRKSIIKLIIDKVPFFIVFLFVLYSTVSGKDKPPSVQNTPDVSVHATQLTMDVNHADRAVIQSGHLDFSLPDRLLLSCYAYVRYIFKLTVPVGLSIVYPHPYLPGESPPHYLWMYPAGIMILLIVFIYSLLRYRIPAFAIMFFTFNIFFALQIVPVTNSVINDRYTYVASIGYFVLVGSLYSATTSMPVIAGRISRVFFICYVAILCLLAFQQCKVFKNSISLWDNVISKYPDSVTAYCNRGVAKHDSGNIKGSIDDLSHAIQLNTGHALSRANRGLVLHSIQDYSGALRDFNTAINLTPGDGNLYYYRGKTEIELNYPDEGIKDFTAAIKISPDNYEAYFQRGTAQMLKQNCILAMEDLKKVIEISPGYAEAYYNIGVCCFYLNYLEDAVKWFEQSILLNPGYGAGYFGRGMVNIDMGRHELGCADLEQAAKLGYSEAETQLKARCGE